MKSKAMKYLVVATLVSTVMCQCATTTLFEKGQPIARFQGDMSKISYVRTKDGTTKLSGDINHSNPTKAGGDAVTNLTTAVGASVTAGSVTTLLK